MTCIDEERTGVLGTSNVPNTCPSPSRPHLSAMYSTIIGLFAPSKFVTATVTFKRIPTSVWPLGSRNMESTVIPEIKGSAFEPSREAVIERASITGKKRGVDDG